MAAGSGPSCFPNRAGFTLLVLLASACATSGAGDTSPRQDGSGTGEGREDPVASRSSPASPGSVERGAPRDDPAPTLEGGEWVVAELDGEPLLDRSRITLAFEEGQVSGLASCNRYVADWSRPAPSGIRVAPPRSTLQACAPAVMDQERHFLGLLERLRSIRMEGEGNLLLQTPQGETVRAHRR